MRGGRRTGPPDRWQDARDRFRGDIADLPGPTLRIEDPEPVRPVWSRALQKLTATVRASIEARFRPDHLAAPSGTAASHSSTLSADAP
jgi:nicotinate phosphoribosyltransferase